MYGGFKIIDCGTENGATPTAALVVGEYKEHSSISYGCDWSLLTGENVSRLLNVREFDGRKICALIGTCSFYDHAFKLSAVCPANGDWPDSSGA